MSPTRVCAASLILALLPAAAMAVEYPYPGVPAPIAPKVLPKHPSLRQVFVWLDTNHDGFLTMQEYLAAPWLKNKPRAARFFHWMDTNKDGLVSLPEFLAAHARYCRVHSVQVAYPWGWTFWRPWRYGWTWHNGWHHRPVVRQAYAVHAHRHVKPPAAHRPGVPAAVKHTKHAKPAKAKHGKHAKHAKPAKPAKAKHAKAKSPKGKHAGHRKGHAAYHR
jgi:hypothetical protein